MRKRTLKYYVDETYFEKVDTEAKAYILGFLYADGYVDRKRSRVATTINKDDMEVLDFIKKELKYTGVYYKNTNGNKQKNCLSLFICRQKMARDICALGCYPAKSLTLKFPIENQVPRHLIRHFIRGFFDGDGCISSSELKPEYYFSEFSFISTHNMCRNIRDILEQDLLLGRVKMRPRKTKAGPYIYTLGYHYADTMKSRMFDIYNYLYEGASFYLARKHSRFLQIFERAKQHKLGEPIRKDIQSRCQQGRRIREKEYIGVSRSNGYFRATIARNGIVYCRSFSEADECARQYDKMALYLYGTNAKLNFSREDYSEQDISETFSYFTTDNYTSKFKYVDFLKHTGRWRAAVPIGKKRICRMHIDENVAAEWADKLNAYYNKDYDNLNFPEKKDFYKTLTEDDILAPKKRSTIRGIKYNSDKKQWEATLHRLKVAYFCGYYDTREAAIKAVDTKRKQFI